MRELWEGICDDAAIFPPGNSPLPEAVAAHCQWLESDNAWMVGPFICDSGRLDELAGLVPGFPISVTVPDGPSSAGAARRMDLNVVSIEVPYAEDGWEDLIAATEWATVYVEVPLGLLNAELARRLAAAGLRLKLRTGGTKTDLFPTSTRLGEGLVAAVRGELPFKLTAGLHNAVRHRDPGTGFEHHGFANVLVATAAARAGAGVDEVAAALEEHAPGVVAAAVKEIGIDVRLSFTSFGTCSLQEPLDDLAALGLLNKEVA